jgi:ABC-2 type transport system permease protein
MGHGRDGRELAGQIARIALVSALLGGFGVVAGALVRNQVVAVVGMLLLSFVVEPAVIGLVPEAGRYGPFVALPTAAVGLPEGDAGLGNVDLLPAGLAVALMPAWIGAAFAAGLTLLRRRDVG